MTASDRQRKTIKHAPKHRKHGGKRKGKVAVKPTPLDHASEETRDTSPMITKTESQSEETRNVSPIQPREETDEVVLVHNACKGPSSNVSEESSSGVAFKEGNGGPVDKSILKTFKDHIVYAVWNGEEVYHHLCT